MSKLTERRGRTPKTKAAVRRKAASKPKASKADTVTEGGDVVASINSGKVNVQGTLHNAQNQQREGAKEDTQARIKKRKEKGMKKEKAKKVGFWKKMSNRAKVTGTWIKAKTVNGWNRIKRSTTWTKDKIASGSKATWNFFKHNGVTLGHNLKNLVTFNDPQLELNLA